MHPSLASSPPGRRVRLWTAIWCLLAVLHVTQSIWTSGGRAYPGDLADGRFNQLVLEHGYQALRGVRPWNSPNQFYPVANTLGFSDTHAGTLPIYAGARWLSISREEAWQVWFVVVAVLNAWAACRFLRALGVHPWLRGPFVFATAGSALFVWVACTHVQMLPLFPALFACEQALRWRDDRLAWRGLTVAGWACWQFAASPYAAFFSLVVVVLAVAAHGIVGWGFPRAKSNLAATSRKADWLGATLVFLAGAGLAVATIAVYLSVVRAGYSRPVWEIIAEAPKWTSWFRAPPLRAIPSFVPAIPGKINLTEHCWFAGWIAWALVLAIVVAGAPLRQLRVGRLALSLAVVAIITPLLFTDWTASGNSAWIWLGRRIEFLRAFRASGRVAVPLQFALTGAAALFLSHFLTAGSRRWIRIGAVVVACALAAENFCPRQRFTLTATARARTQAMIAAWKSAGDRPVLVYAPGAVAGESAPFAHLDAWSAALQLRRATVNGYSGNAPASHMAFMMAPTPERARATLRAIGLAEKEVSFVDRPIETNGSGTPRAN